jgi:ankyrin
MGGITISDINFTMGKLQYTPLMLAVTKGNEDFIKLLLTNKSIEIDKENANGVNAFWIACYGGHGGIMKVLAEEGTDIFVSDRQKGENVLHLACKKNYVNIVKMLLNSKYPYDQVTKKGFTAVHIAAKYGNIKCIAALYEAGVDISAVNNDGISPLYLAILNKQQGKKAAEFLIEQKCKFHYDMEELRDMSPIFLVIREQQNDLLELMCDYDAVLTVQNKEGLTPLMYASKLNLHDVVLQLSLRTRDLNQEDFNSMTILMHYIGKENKKICQKLLTRGADINYINRNGVTALHYALDSNKKEAVRFLLERKADPHIVDLYGEDCCDKAKRNGFVVEFP